MSKQLSFLLLFSVIFSGYSQTFDYVGFIKLENNTFINYTLNLKIDNGVARGFSFTDLNGDHETKSSVVGKFSSDGNRLEFREVDIVYTKSPIAQFDFCYIFFKGKLSANRLIGNFKAYYDDLVACTTGEVMLSKSKKVEKRQSRITKKIQRKLARKNIEDTLTHKLEEMKFGEKRGLKNGENLNVFWKKSYIKLSIWDAGTVDMDTITIRLNDGAPLRIIPEKKFTVKEFYLKKEKNTIVIEAISEGYEPPNTTKIKISDGDGQTIDLISDLKVGDKASLTFYRQIPNRKDK